MKAPKTRREKKYTPKAQADRETMPFNETLAMLWRKKKSLKK
jgi:hypothetical protein